MTQIVLTEEQARLAAQAQKALPVCDPQGRIMGRFEPLIVTPEEIAEVKHRAKSPGPWYTSEQVQARLRALQEEWDRTGGFNEAYMHEFLERLNAADPGHMRPKEQAG